MKNKTYVIRLIFTYTFAIALMVLFLLTACNTPYKAPEAVTGGNNDKQQ